MSAMVVHGAPWRFSPSHVEEGPSAVRASEGWLVCETSSDEHARLIALAPELLGVLQEANAAINSAMAQVDAEWRNHDKAGDKHDKIVREFRSKVRAIITKATGQ